MLLPAGIGVLVGMACRDVADRLMTRLRAVVVAALAAAVSWLVLAALAGGALGDGPFDPVIVPAGSLAVSVFLLIAIPGALTVWLAPRVPALLAIDDTDEIEEFEEEPETEEETEAEPESE
jgi:ABC-type Co2+ transport system permease subunit